MLTLVKFLITVGVVAGVIFVGLFTLANFVDPKPREITVNVTADKFNREPAR